MAFASALVVTATGVLVAFAYFEFAVRPLLLLILSFRTLGPSFLQEDVVKQCVSIANHGKIVVKLLYVSNSQIT